jgi:nucleoid-associated protein EbfC
MTTPDTRERAMRGGGQPNLQQIMQQAQMMQQKLVEAQAALAEAEVTGTSGGGLVTVTMTGAGEVRAVKIDPKAVDPDDVETLEDLVVAALNNAADNLKRLTEEKMGPLTAGLGGLGGGLGLPGM